MADKLSSASLTQKLTLLVLILILGCLGAILFQMSNPSAPPDVAQVDPPELILDAPKPPPIDPARPFPTVRVTRPAMPSLTPPAELTPALPPPPAEPRPEPPPPVPVVVATPVPAATAPVVVPGVGVAATPGTNAMLVFEALPSGSEMRIDGDSTAHKWHCLGKIISGKFEVDSNWLTSLALIGRTSPLTKCELKIPVRTLKSQVPVGSSIMDSRMQAEMRMKWFSNIEYKLARLSVTALTEGTNNTTDLSRPLEFDAVGDLAISGATNRVTFPVKMQWTTTNVLHITGSYRTKMSAFRIKPPEFTIMGAGVRTADDITLTWTWLLGLKPEAIADR